MKKIIFSRKSFLFSALFLVLLVFFFLGKKKDGPIHLNLDEENEEVSKPSDNPIARAQYEFNMLKDPKTGKIPEGVRFAELAEAEIMPLKEGNAFSPALVNNYAFAGPSNFGGRVRSITYDVRFNGTSNQIIFAGGVSGGLFKSTDNGTSWTKVSPPNFLYSVTAIAQDPRVGQQDTWYYATGEGLGSSASETGAFYLGYGVYKSTDNGANWAKIPNAPFAEGALESFDSRFDIISSLAVNPINGDLYAGTMNSVMRLPGGAGSWSTEIGLFAGTTAGVVDVKIGSNGIVYAAIPGNGFMGNGNANANSVAWEGVWRRNLAGAWTRIGGQGTPAWFNFNPAGVPSQLGRIVLAIDPTDERNVYALYDNTLVSDCFGGPAAEAEFGKYDTLTATWVDLSAGLPNEAGCLEGNDPFAVQGGYDLVMAVKPGNSNNIFIGGTNIYRLSSANTFADATYTSTRVGGYVSSASYGRYANSHPDIHAIAFQPGTPNIMLCGNDGGIQKTSDNTAGSVAWTDISNGFATYQYYYVAIDPTVGSTRYIGGAQDNGTTYRSAGTNAMVKSFSGDGVSVGIAAANASHFVGTQLGEMYRKNPASGEGVFSANLTPSAASISLNTLFITLFHLDPDNTDNLYYVDFNELWRSTNATTAPNFNAGFAELTGVRTAIGGINIRSIATSRGTYNTATSKLYFGTDDGRIFRIDDPRNVAVATAPTQINTGAGMPVGTISAIAVNPRNSDTVLAVYSNYGIQNIWVSLNATSGAPTWTNIEGNLTLPSIRSAAIVVTHTAEYYVGTSTGLYSTGALAAGGTVWTKEGSSSIGNAVVTSLALRPADNTLLVGTHGNGMYSSAVFALPIKLKSFNGRAEAKQNFLYWTVEEEVNSKGYEIERKYSDELKYTKIGFVQSRSDNSQRRDYSFSDISVDLGKPFANYRLKQIDLDGKTAVSPVVSINRKASSKFVEYVASNNNILTIRFNDANNQQNVMLRLFDMSGRMVRQSNIRFETQQMNITALARGPMIIQIVHPDGRKYVQKFIH